MGRPRSFLSRGRFLSIGVLVGDLFIGVLVGEVCVGLRANNAFFCANRRHTNQSKPIQTTTTTQLKDVRAEFDRVAIVAGAAELPVSVFKAVVRSLLRRHGPGGTSWAGKARRGAGRDGVTFAPRLGAAVSEGAAVTGAAVAGFDGGGGGGGGYDAASELAALGSDADLAAGFALADRTKGG